MFCFFSHIEMLVSDTHDSSTIKTTHFKEDEAGDLKGAEGQDEELWPPLLSPPLKQRKRNRAGRGNWRRAKESSQGYECTNTRCMTSVFVCKKKKRRVFLAEVCPQVFTSSYDSEGEEAKEKERWKLKTVCGHRMVEDATPFGLWQ